MRTDGGLGTAPAIGLAVAEELFLCRRNRRPLVLLAVGLLLLLVVWAWALSVQNARGEFYVPAEAAFRGPLIQMVTLMTAIVLPLHCGLRWSGERGDMMRVIHPSAAAGYLAQCLVRAAIAATAAWLEVVCLHLVYRRVVGTTVAGWVEVSATAALSSALIGVLCLA